MLIVFPGLGEYPSDQIITLNDLKDLDIGEDKSDLSDALALQSLLNPKEEEGPARFSLQWRF